VIVDSFGKIFDSPDALFTPPPGIYIYKIEKDTIYK